MVFVRTQDAREFVRETIPVLLGAGWTCLDTDAYLDDDDHPWRENVCRPLWVPPDGGLPLPINQARNRWAREQFDNLAMN